MMPIILKNYLTDGTASLQTEAVNQLAERPTVLS